MESTANWASLKAGPPTCFISRNCGISRLRAERLGVSPRLLKRSVSCWLPTNRLPQRIRQNPPDLQESSSKPAGRFLFYLAQLHPSRPPPAKKCLTRLVRTPPPQAPRSDVAHSVFSEQRRGDAAVPGHSTVHRHLPQHGAVGAVKGVGRHRADPQNQRTSWCCFLVWGAGMVDTWALFCNLLLLGYWFFRVRFLGFLVAK